MKPFKNLTLSIRINRLLGWGCLALGSYGFVLFMLPIVLRLSLSVGLLVLGASCLYLPSIYRRVFTSKGGQEPSRNETLD